MCRRLLRLFRRGNLRRVSCSLVEENETKLNAKIEDLTAKIAALAMKLKDLEGAIQQITTFQDPDYRLEQ